MDSAPWNRARAIADVLAVAPALHAFPTAVTALVAAYLDAVWLLFMNAPGDPCFAVSPALALAGFTSSATDVWSTAERQWLMSAAFAGGIVPLHPPTNFVWTKPPTPSSSSSSSSCGVGSARIFTSSRNDRGRARDQTVRCKLTDVMLQCRPGPVPVREDESPNDLLRVGGSAACREGADDSVALLAGKSGRRNASGKAARPFILSGNANGSCASGNWKGHRQTPVALLCYVRGDRVSRAGLRLDFDTGRWCAAHAATPKPQLGQWRHQWRDGAVLLYDFGELFVQSPNAGSDFGVGDNYQGVEVPALPHGVLSVGCLHTAPPPHDCASSDSACEAKSGGPTRALVAAHGSKLSVYWGSFDTAAAEAERAKSGPRGSQTHATGEWRTRDIPKIATSGVSNTASRHSGVPNEASLHSEDSARKASVEDTRIHVIDIYDTDGRTEGVLVYQIERFAHRAPQLYVPATDSWRALPNWTLPDAVLARGNYQLSQADDWLVLTHSVPSDDYGDGVLRVTTVLYVLDAALGAEGGWWLLTTPLMCTRKPPRVVPIPPCFR